MKEQERLEEYRQKGRILFEDYKEQSQKLRANRFGQPALRDAGVKEEIKLKKIYNHKQEILKEEYKDILHLINKS